MVDFQNMNYDELDQLVMERLVFDTKELSLILKGHLFIERLLERYLRANLPNPGVLFKEQFSFSQKLKTAFATGVIPERHYSAINALNKIRNQYAHSDSYIVSIKELTHLKVQWEPIQEKAFEVSCTRGIEETTFIAVLFLCWSVMGLLKVNKE